VVEALIRPGPEGEALALLRLLDIPGLGTRRLFQLLSEVGGAERALRRLGRNRSTASKSDPERSPRVVALERMAVLDRLGVHVLALWSDVYPDRLRELHDPPACLFVRGDVSALVGPTVAVVGSRRCTAYGRHAAESIGSALSQRGIHVVSGLALGIDGAAHKGAVESNGTPVAVLGNGIDRIHPRTHARLGQVVLQHGAVISEFPPGIPALGHHFPQRNRIIAALSQAVVVVEAASRSGALITTEFALELGRDVYAVPGPMGANTHMGTLALIRDGAGVVTSPEALADELAESLPGTYDQTEHPCDEGPTETADPRAGKVLAALAEGVLDLDTLCEGLCLAAPEALAVLAELELGGRVRQEAGLRFRRV
jgi:DNA processing protein